jgi:hypothetical protein
VGWWGAVLVMGDVGCYRYGCVLTSTTRGIDQLRVL